MEAKPLICPTCGAETRADGLSAKEQEVLDLLSQGYKQNAIARFMQIRVNTVGVYVTHINRKLGLGDNFDMARFELKRRAEILERSLRMKHPDAQAARKAFCEYSIGKF